MQYGICPLSIVPLRVGPDHTSEMTTQLLYGDLFKVLERRKKWSKIRIASDASEGWINNHQYQLIEEENYHKAQESKQCSFITDLVAFVSPTEEVLIPITLGACLDHLNLLGHQFEGESNHHTGKSNFINTALLYLNTPYLWGGKTPFGIDAGGLTQMVYKINGHALSRTPSQQATQGEALSFIEESEAGDLAFFDNNEGIIDHVGIIMKDNYIIHAYGSVRIDRLDHTGIFNTELNNYTHKLRVIKKITS